VVVLYSGRGGGQQPAHRRSLRGLGHVLCGPLAPPDTGFTVEPRVMAVVAEGRFPQAQCPRLRDLAGALNPCSTPCDLLNPPAPSSVSPSDTRDTVAWSPWPLGPCAPQPEFFPPPHQRVPSALPTPFLQPSNPFSIFAMRSRSVVSHPPPVQSTFSGPREER